jgi:hypothetical protein
MTGNDVPTPGGLPPGPPWPVDLLADLHAGVLDPPDADELRRRVEADPDAGATLAAFDATQRALAGLPRPRMPEDVAVRIDAAIAREAAARAGGPPTLGGEAAAGAGGGPTAPAVNLATERALRRRLIAGAGILAAAAAIAVFTVANFTGGTTDGQPNAGPSDTRFETSTGPLALSSNNLGDALQHAFGATEYGPLGGAGRLAGCLSANKVDPATVPLGAKQVTFDGKPGVLIVLPAGSNPPKWRLLVVSQDCGPNNPATLADTTTG